MADIIHALSSGAPPSGVAVIRISGSGCLDLVRKLTRDRSLPPERKLMLRSIYAAKSGQLIDRPLIVIFAGPNSFTGEDSVEIHCHGSPAVVAAVQQSLVELGSRPAEAGEFTRRAFESGRIDLTQAEALSDLIAAETEAQRDMALANAEGRLRGRITAWREQLIDLMADLEADLDFSDEGDVAGSEGREGCDRLEPLITDMRTALGSQRLAERVRHGLTIAITGAPNVGKSSLLNAMAGRDVAIVTPHAGTTRDLIEVHLDLGGRPVTLVDTAGLRETADPVEAEGIARARSRASESDLVLDLGPDPQAGEKRVAIISKIDLTGAAAGFHDGAFHISTRTGAGMDALETWLANWAASQIPSGETPLVTTERQGHLLSETLAHLESAQKEQDIVLMAERLRSAAHTLGRLSGLIDPETILGAIFSRFCIGK